jgi:hypothetical protein
MRYNGHIRPSRRLLYAAFGFLLPVLVLLVLVGVFTAFFLHPFLNEASGGVQFIVGLVMLLGLPFMVYTGWRWLTKPNTDSDNADKVDNRH